MLVRCICMCTHINFWQDLSICCVSNNEVSCLSINLSVLPLYWKFVFSLQVYHKYYVKYAYWFYRCWTNFYFSFVFLYQYPLDIFVMAWVGTIKCMCLILSYPVLGSYWHCDFPVAALDQLLILLLGICSSLVKVTVMCHMDLIRVRSKVVV